MMWVTPGTPPGRWRASRAAPGRVKAGPCGGGAAALPLPPPGAAPGVRSAVSVTATPSTPGSALTTLSAAWRKASNSPARAGSTEMAK